MERIKNRIAVIGIVGLGYVGLPLAVESAKSGYRVIGFDVQEAKVNKLNSGINYIGDIVDSELKELVMTGKLRGTTDFELIKEVDIVLNKEYS